MIEVRSLSATGALDSHRPAARFQRLTGQELQVLGRLLVRAMTAGPTPCSNQAIAADLGIGRLTVKKHIEGILAKTGARNRTVLAVTTVRSILALR